MQWFWCLLKCNIMELKSFLQMETSVNALMIILCNIVGIELTIFAGERIFRIGLVCYKMDSSKQTLQRISGGPLLIFLLFMF